MPVAFKELGGSPLEDYSPSGFTARRRFLIAWEDRDAFAAEVMGLAAAHGSGVAVKYPGKATVFATRVRYEPFDPDSPDLKTLTDLTRGLNSYSNSFAEATVDYATITPRDRDDGPGNEVGTHLTYRMTFLAEDQPLLADGWKWSDTGLAVPDDLPLAKSIPMTEHRLTWHQVIRPPWDAIHALQGKVNTAAFLGCPAGTVLFVGAEANKLFRSGYAEGPSEFAWEIAYVFRERSIKHAGGVYGWNHAYRGDPAGWVALTNGTAGLYDAGDLNVLFQSAAP